MAGFEPGYSSIGSDRSANCTTTTSLIISMFSWKFGTGFDWLEMGNRNGSNYADLNHTKKLDTEQLLS